MQLPNFQISPLKKQSEKNSDGEKTQRQIHNRVMRANIEISEFDESGNDCAGMKTLRFIFSYMELVNYSSCNSRSAMNKVIAILRYSLREAKRYDRFCLQKIARIRKFSMNPTNRILNVKQFQDLLRKILFILGDQGNQLAPVSVTGMSEFFHFYLKRKIEVLSCLDNPLPF